MLGVLTLLVDSGGDVEGSSGELTSGPGVVDGVSVDEGASVGVVAGVDVGVTSGVLVVNVCVSV